MLMSRDGVDGEPANYAGMILHLVSRLLTNSSLYDCLRFAVSFLQVGTDMPGRQTISSSLAPHQHSRFSPAIDASP